MRFTQMNTHLGRTPSELSLEELEAIKLRARVERAEAVRAALAGLFAWIGQTVPEAGAAAARTEHPKPYGAANARPCR